MQAKARERTGAAVASHLDMEFAEHGRRGPDRVRGAPARGRSTAVSEPLSAARQDALEETWRAVQPLLDVPHAPGSGGFTRRHPGTSAADDLVRGYGGWREPWLPS